MFGLSPYESAQIVVWIVMGGGVIATQQTTVKWLRADVSRALQLINGIHSRLDRHEKDLKDELSSIHERISATRESLARQEAVCQNRRAC